MTNKTAFPWEVRVCFIIAGIAIMLSILSCALAVDKLREQVKVLEQKIQVLENR